MEHSVYSDKFVEANKLVESDSDEDFFDDITIDNMLLVSFLSVCQLFKHGNM